MKISTNDLKQIIQEEALRLFQIEKLEEAKRAVDENIKLISEGKKKMSDEELEELWGGIKNVLGAGAKAVGQLGQKIADKYKEGEKSAKINSLTKQQADLTAKLQAVTDELNSLTASAAPKTSVPPPPVPPKAKKTSTPPKASTPPPAPSKGKKAGPIRTPPVK